MDEVKNKRKRMKSCTQNEEVKVSKTGFSKYLLDKYGGE
jgi:hypothetical protein